MEWIEWLLSREFRQLLLDNNLFFPLLFVVRLLIHTGRFIFAPTVLSSPADGLRYRALMNKGQPCRGLIQFESRAGHGNEVMRDGVDRVATQQ